MVDNGHFKEVLPNTYEEEMSEGPLDLSYKRKQTEDKQSTFVTEIFDIFAHQLTKIAAENPATNSTKNLRTQLKHQTYGEVLTTKAIIKILKEAEEMKKNKRNNDQEKDGPFLGSHGRPRKVKEMESEEIETTNIDNNLQEERDETDPIEPKRKRGRPRKERKEGEENEDMGPFKKEQEKNEEISGMTFSVDIEVIGLEKCIGEVGEYVIFQYEGSYFSGKIIKTTKEEAKISAMKKSLKLWKWPSTPDVTTLPWKYIVEHIKPLTKD